MNITTLGIDLAKNVFQLCGVNAAGAIQFNKKVTRNSLVKSERSINLSITHNF